MARTARRYDLYLPLTNSAGHPIADAAFDSGERRRLDHFGGLTSQQREFLLRGIWQGGSNLYLDQVIIMMTVLDFRRQAADGSSRDSSDRSCANSTSWNSSLPSNRYMCISQSASSAARRLGAGA